MHFNKTKNDTVTTTPQILVKDTSVTNIAPSKSGIHVSLLTGGFDRPYAFGLTMVLAAKGINVEVIGSAEVDSHEMHTTPGVNFRNIQGDPREKAGLIRKVQKLILLYLRICWYAVTAKPKIFHILWNNKLWFFDRTLLMLYYKLFGKKIVFTAHNVNAGRRDGKDTWLNRFSLKTQYRLVDHIFVHTEKMKSELLQEYGVHETAVTVIPFGINNSVPDTDLTPAKARERLGIGREEKVMLFFGALREYKGVEYVVEAFQQLSSQNPDYRLIIAGEAKKGSMEYWYDIKKKIEAAPSCKNILQRIEFVPDSETELYFKAADVSVLPYTVVFQSGVLFLSYSFGLPVIASDVGNFRDDIIEGETGLVCKPCDAADLARAIQKYFESELFKNLNARRQTIRDYATARHSWDVVGDLTHQIYFELLRR